MGLVDNYDQPQTDSQIPQPGETGGREGGRGSQVWGHNRSFLLTCRFLDTESMATTPRGGSDPNEFSLMGPGKELDTCASVQWPLVHLHILCLEVQPAFPTWTRRCFKYQLGLWKMSITSWFQAPLFRTLNMEPGSDQTWFEISPDTVILSNNTYRKASSLQFVGLC